MIASGIFFHLYYGFFHLMTYGVHKTVSKFIYEFFYNISGVFPAIETFLVSKC